MINKIKAVVFLLTVALTAAAYAGDAQYLVVMIDGQKCGHAVHQRTVEDDKVFTLTEVYMSINRLGITMDVTEKTKYIETVDGKPLGFETEQKFSGTAAQKFSGRISEGVLTVSEQGQPPRELPFHPKALMPEGIDLYMQEKGFKVGQKFEFVAFDASLMNAMPVTIEVFEKEMIDLFGRIKELYKTVTTATMPGAGDVRTTSFVDEDLNVYKSSTWLMGLTIEMIAADKAVALSPDEPADIFSQLLIQSPIQIPDYALKKSITYTLKITGELEQLNIPNSDNQSASEAEQGIMYVRVAPVTDAVAQKLPVKYTEESLQEFLSPNSYVQSDDERIIALSKKAIGDAKTDLEAARNIEQFVYDYITNKNLSVGYATALEVLKSKEGDCTEHAVLAAALCRAAGIPTKVVSGIVYAEAFAGAGNIFGGHAWNECYIGGKWIGIDSSIGANRYGSGHIKLAAGDGRPEAFFALINLLGNFEIIDIKY